MSADHGSRQHAVEQQLVDTVVASFADAADPRVKFVMERLVSHLHDFVRDVRLTEAEWAAGIDFLTRAGHITTDHRQEFILLSDVLGISMQTIAVNHPAAGDLTESTVFGPFFVDESPHIELGGDLAGGAHGQPCWVEGTVTSADGAPIPGARIEVWEADEEGLYDVQRADGELMGRAHLFTDGAGRYRFWGLTPTPYPIPDDGPVGQLLTAVGRSPYRAAHLHFMVTAPGYADLITHIFVEGDPLVESDSVFGVKESLIKPFVQHTAADLAPDGRHVADDGWASVRFDIVLDVSR
ncbi:MAG: hypothetical protein JWP32_1687 [Schumannella sp.]|nr:hypothetical protein [Schumannella sp.]